MEEEIKNTGVGFHGKVILLFLAFAVYAGLELSLNILLIDLYAQPVDKVFIEQAETVTRLDLFGRTLSSFGITFAVLSFIPLNKFMFWSKQAKSQKYSKTVATWLIRPLAFLLIWILLIPSLRLFVEGWVHTTSHDKKLSAVRAVIYKEGYLSKSIKMEDFDEFNAIAEDEERRDLVVALIPSLAYFSNSFNKLIEQNTETLATTFLSNDQERRFAEQGLPKLRSFDQLYRSEYKLYKEANDKYVKAIKGLNDGSQIAKEQKQLIASVNKAIQSNWDIYVGMFERAGNQFRNTAKAPALREAHHKFKKQSRAKGCYGDCRDDVNRRHADYLNNLRYEGGQPLGIKVLPEHILFTALGTEDRIELMLERGRKHWLRLVYGIGEEEKFEEFIVTDNARKMAIKEFKERGIELPPQWQFSQTNLIAESLRNKYQKQAKNIWQDYKKSAQFDITEIGLDRIAFASSAKVLNQAKKTLGQFYIEDFSPGLPESLYTKKWLAQQDNISFVRMVTSTAAVAAFAPGGALYDIGNDAVKLAVIPPVSVVLTFVAILMLFFKFGYYLFVRNKIYCALLSGCAAMLIVVPAVQSVNKENSYSSMMSTFAEEFHTNEKAEYIGTLGFGYFLDLENALFENYRNLPFVRSVAKAIMANNKAQGSDASTNSNDALINDINSYDDTFNQLFSWLPSIAGTGDIKTFDANITILKRDHSVGAFIGIYLEKGKVKKVSMPNFLENKDLALLAEQRFFYNPDIKQLAKDFSENYVEPDYLLSIANGSFIRESAISKIEKSMVTLINNQKSLLDSINTLKSTGHANMILVQMNKGEDYRCYTTPAISASSLANTTRINSVNYQELDNCRGVL